MMNPNPCEIVELFSFVEVTLIQYVTVAGHFPKVTASSVKPKPKKANKAEPPKEETQANATTPTTPKPKAKGQARGTSQTSPAKVEAKPPEAKKGGKVEVRVSVENRSRDLKRGNSNASPSFEVRQKGDQCKYEHQVGDDGRPVPVGPETLQKYDEAVKRFNESKAQAKAKAALVEVALMLS